jgi:hypothetical protein
MNIRPLLPVTGLAAFFGSVPPQAGPNAFGMKQKQSPIAIGIPVTHSESFRNGCGGKTLLNRVVDFYNNLKKVNVDTLN